MHRRDFGQKKNDWVLIAYIIQRQGGEASVEQIRSSLSAWKKRNKTTRQISGIMASNKRQGFERVGERFKNNSTKRYVSIWCFKGDLPEINHRTLQHWEEKLSPLGDNP